MKHIFDYIKKNKSLLIVIIPGFIFLMLTIVPSGSTYCYQDKCGLFFWGANAHDAIWHLALTATSFNQWPFITPIFSGASLSGYNYLIDLIFYVLNFFKIPALFSYFKLFPIAWFIIFTSLSIILGRKIKDSPIFIGILLFYFYFGSSFTFIFPLYHNKTIWGSASLLSMQSGQNLTNLPFAFSLIIILLILIILKKNILLIKDNLLLGILVSINLGIKFYAGMISLFLVCIYYLLVYLNSKHIFNKYQILSLIRSYFIVGIFIIIAVLIFYNPSTSLKSGAIFILSPFATMHPIIEEPALFYIHDVVNARYFLYSIGISPRLILIEIFSSMLFLFFSMGVRVISPVYFLIKTIQKKINKFDITIFLTSLLSYVVLVLFTQKGQWWNTIQFYYYFLFLMNIFTALFVSEMLLKKKKIISIAFIIIIIVVSLPGNIDILRNFVSFPAPAYISKEELKALSFLKLQPKGIVLTQLFDKKRGDLYKDPRPIYIAEDSAYVSAFSAKPVYFVSLGQLEVTGIDYVSRLKKIKNGDCSIFQEVKYIYQIKNIKDNLVFECLQDNQDKVMRIFDNYIVRIYLRK